MPGGSSDGLYRWVYRWDGWSNLVSIPVDIRVCKKLKNDGRKT